MIICNPGIKPKNKHIQTILASSKVRLLRLKNKTSFANTKKEVIETPDAKLLGFYNQKEKAESLYILIHGWEGSSNSTYIQLLANTLLTKKNASVYRLNLRDHGESHHLNKQIFHSCRLEEVLDAVKVITEKYNYKNYYLCGFSLGGNFSLRVAANVYDKQIKLNKVFAISPPIDPKKSMIAIEASKIYSRYFMKKWKRSLIKKRELFPDLFEEESFYNINSLNELTQKLIVEHSEYETTDEYFQGYSITKETLEKISIPCDVITSWDDPVIPFEDFNILDKQENVKLVTSKHGGHCGFINSWKMTSWIEQYILENS
ncbi:MAG TPA: alpha/beta fold hydrolase [Gammaproteobacteria bacterium]|mgnify:CR=1 FL=1|nr:alpha/beta fold hydrolase [Xanthomonadales bacterium]HOP22121.1 alpha/beta fold hydrolase [Gammaproteobacteria bacterium]HPI94617.1 alpha/beta fold hydrolase [Gammaproteobacteria bacterium]HPQ86062.1 alpha/beta fold hydrolase [Gammaproteobacteria bacterium]